MLSPLRSPPLKSHGRRQRGRDSNGKERSKVDYQKVRGLKQCKVWQSVGSARCVAERGVLWRPMSYRRVDHGSKVLSTSCCCVDRLLLVGFPFAPLLSQSGEGVAVGSATVYVAAQRATAIVMRIDKRG